MEQPKVSKRISDGSQSNTHRRLNIPKKISLKLNQKFSLNTELYTPKGDMTARQNPETSMMNFDKISYN